MIASRLLSTFGVTSKEHDMKLLMTVVAIVMGCLTMPLAQATPAGTIILASGEVAVRGASGAPRPAVIGMSIESGDTITTLDGRAQIKFLDGGLISLQPTSEFKITDYRFQDGAKNGNSSVFNLIKGGVRAITGLIGRREKAAYMLQTDVATIGIRGTEFQALLCASSCKEPDGLYVHTGEGTIFVRNAIGEIDVGKGQTAYVASPDAAPQITTTTPAMTAAATTATGCRLCAIPGITDPGFQPGTILSTNSLGNIVPSSGGGLAVAGSGGSASFTSSYNGITYTTTGGAGAGAGYGSVLVPAGGSGLAGFYLNGNAVQGFVVTYSGPTSGGGAYVTSSIASVVFGAVLNAGSDGSLYWGRWSGTTITGYAGLNGIYASETYALPSTTSLHYLIGNSVVTIPGAGIAIYNFIGGTPSTDQSGAVGLGITSGTLTANFGTNTVGANMTVNHGGVYTLAANMPLHPLNRGAFSSTLPSGSVTGAPVGSQVEGFFGGTNTATGPSQAGVSYLINATSPIVGVGAFRQ